MTVRKHIATYPLYGTHPISGTVNTRNRIGTGYIYGIDDIEKVQARCDRMGHPFRIRWRNDEVRLATLERAIAKAGA